MPEMHSLRGRRPSGTRVGAPAALSAFALLALSALSAPAVAHAGQYHVYSCRTPSGESAPADGWSGSESGSESVAEDTCSSGGALIAGLHAHTPRTANSAAATWAFSVPTDETLAGATLWRAGDAAGGAAGDATYETWLAGPAETNIFEECLLVNGCTGNGDTAQPLSGANRVAVPASNLGQHLYAVASCGGVSGYNCPEGGSDANGYAAVVYLYAADLVLEQSAGPTASNVGGEVASAPVLSGTSDVVFDASDPGSGVYEAVFSVDGQVVQQSVIDEADGHCKNVGQTTDGLAAFLYVQPCPASVNADVGFETTRVANGEHHLVVSVTDAAGNSAVVLDRNVTIANAPPPGAPNGANASAHAALAVKWKGTRGSRLTSAYGASETVEGRLTSSTGAPITGAHVAVLATPAYQGARTAAIATPVTSADGAFTLRLAAGLSSRTLRFEYSAALDSPPVVSTTLTLAVRAGVALHVTPHTASAGSSIEFSGRLRGGPVPRGGKLLVLEARSPGGAWLEFDVVRSDGHGRFRASYRFKFPGPAAYQFRVVCEAEADYPYATGASNVVGVFER